jgi:hypothetical protein
MDLGQLLVGEGILAIASAEEAEGRATEAGRALASILVDEGHVPEDALADAVARAIGTLVIDVDLGALDRESVRLIPESFARRFLLIAGARGASGRSLRVAFANPLDDDAVASVRELTGLEVEPMVATVSGVKAALDREYSARNTEIIRGPRSEARPELPPEDTQQLLGPRDPTNAGTDPIHRIESEATMEQRHEALLLTLIEAGVLTRSDYVAALRRLKGKK